MRTRDLPLPGRGARPHQRVLWEFPPAASQNFLIHSAADRIEDFGQNPNHFGEFNSMSSMFKSMHKAGMAANLPGGSNTVFVTVEDLSELEKASLDHELSRLPSELTIIVCPKLT